MRDELAISWNRTDNLRYLSRAIPWIRRRGLQAM